MRCPECMGTLFERGRFEVAEVFQRQPVLIRNVPASRCTQCGHLLISARVSKEIERALTTRSYTSVVPAAVYDLAAPQPRAGSASTRPVACQVATNVRVLLATGRLP